MPEDETSNGCFTESPIVGQDIVDLESGEVAPLGGEVAPIGFFDGALSRDGRYVAATDYLDDGPIGFVMDLASGDRVVEFDPAERGQGFQFVRGLSADGSLVLYGDRPMEVWDVATGEVISTLGVGLGESFQAGFGPTGSTVYAANRDSTLRAFDAMTGEEVFTLPAAGGGRPAVSDEGLLLVFDESTSTASVVDERSRGERATVRTCPGFVYSDSLNVVGSLAAFAIQCDGDDRGSAAIIDLAEMEALRTVIGNDAQASELSPDGTMYALQESDPDFVISPIRIRDARTWELLVELSGACPHVYFDRQSATQCNAFPDVPFPFLGWRMRWSPDGRSARCGRRLPW